MIPQLALAFIVGVIVGIVGMIYLGYVLYKHAEAREAAEFDNAAVSEEAATRIALALLEQERKAMSN